MRLLAFVLLAASAGAAQQAAPVKPARLSAWFNAGVLDFAALSPTPPVAGSRADQRDMEDVLLVQRDRTAAQIAQAQADDREEDIFLFQRILGPHFNAAELPVTAAFSLHLRGASAVINNSLKVRFGRPRPFVASAEVHPVCEKTASNSYPSGHSMVGTLEALALTQIVPERSPEIQQRLDEYLHNRVVCGVHYPSDVAASRAIAYSLFGVIAGSPVFQKELEASRAEVRAHLGLADAVVATTKK